MVYWHPRLGCLVYQRVTLNQQGSCDVDVFEVGLVVVACVGGGILLSVVIWDIISEVLG